MTPETRARLNAINRDFYATTASDFDATRGRAWDGWTPLLAHLDAPLSVLDVGCGNGRFGVFLAQQLTGAIDYHGVDNNAALLDFARDALAPLSQVTATLTQHDVIMTPLPATARYDLVVLFGVIHHVPGAAYRRDFMRRLAQRVAPDGLLIYAAWRFAEYARFQARFADWPDDLERERDDYLLDWRRGERALRYCHHVDDDEQRALNAATGFAVLDQYRADGTDGRMNQYTVLRRLPE